MSTAPADRHTPRTRRTLLWGMLVLLLLVAQSLLVALTVNYESSRSQDEIDAVSSEAAVEVRRNLGAAMQALQSLMWTGNSLTSWQENAAELDLGTGRCLYFPDRGARSMTVFDENLCGLFH